MSEWTKWRDLSNQGLWAWHINCLGRTVARYLLEEDADAILADHAAAARVAELETQRDEFEALFVAQEGAYTRGLTDGIERMTAQLTEECQKVTELAALLRRIEQWDHMQSAADGPYWLREIAAALSATTEEVRE